MILDFDKVERAGRFTFSSYRDSDRYIQVVRDNLTNETYDWPDYNGVNLLIDKWCQAQEDKTVGLTRRDSDDFYNPETPW